MADRIKFSVLKDGTARVETDSVSDANHGNAEILLSDIITRMGGDVQREEKAEGIEHSHGTYSHSHN